MKVFILVIASIVAIQATTEEQEKRLVKLSRECLPISNVDIKILENAEKGGPYADDPKLKIHVFCFSKKANVQNEKGEFNTDVVRDRLNSQMKNKADVEKVLKLCLVQKDTPENTAFTGLLCLQENLPKDVVVY